MKEDYPGAMSGRRVVLFSTDRCPACDVLKSMLATRLPGAVASRMLFSHVRQGETSRRSEHLQAGVRRYPTLQFVEDGVAVESLVGFSLPDSADVLRLLEAFLASDQPDGQTVAAGLPRMEDDA